MRTFIAVFLALAAAIILFTSFQDQLPEELGFLKNKGTVTRPVAVQKSAVAPGTVVSEYQGWTIRKTATAVEFVRPMTGTLTVNGNNYPTPEFGLLCDNGRLDMRIDTRLNTTGRKSTPVEVVGLGKLEWDKSASKNIFPKDSKKILTFLYTTNPANFKLSYAELGAQSVQLDTSALGMLLQALPASCK